MPRHEIRVGLGGTDMAALHTDEDVRREARRRWPRRPWRAAGTDPLFPKAVAPIRPPGRGGRRSWTNPRPTRPATRPANGTSIVKRAAG